jgi:hypothetical protein
MSYVHLRIIDPEERSCINYNPVNTGGGERGALEALPTRAKPPHYNSHRSITNG